jgi:hypothetical protein
MVQENMKKVKPVSVSSAGFTFCRYGVAVLVWLSFLLQIKCIMLVVFLILAFSALLKIEKAPMILLYKYTLGKIVKSKEEILNEHAMRFAHTMGTVISFICLLFLYFININIGWALVFVFAILKTISAFGVCPASKLYECMGNDSCCAFIKKI